ncbi:hypothetical protein AURDEDRAFT_171936 [Auricularia subglabra TFB-10046 SS5]|nr:hypothetical protein AURDEDRAFT_171936 [Auricularia subglabra TFB-10046 SS5]
MAGIQFANPLYFLQNTQRYKDRGSNYDAGDDPLLDVHIMQRLVVSCELAGRRARRLNELLDAEASNVEDAKLPWATAIADRSASSPEAREDNECNEGAHTFEEQLLEMLLEANTQLNDVISRHEAQESMPIPALVSSEELSPSHQRASAPDHLVPQNGSGPDTVQIPLISPTLPGRPPPPYAEVQASPQDRILPWIPSAAGSVGIGHALPPAIMTYMCNRGVSREVLYDVELALEGSSTREWLSALAQIPALTATDCKAVALLYRRSLQADV